MKKRSFLKSIAVVGMGVPSMLENLDRVLPLIEGKKPKEVAKDEGFWAGIRSGYRLKPDYINLENGYYCIIPQETLENHIHHIREVNYQGSYYMRKVQWANKERMHAMLAKTVGCSKEEIVITRNTTESLDTIIGGYPWQPGDEAVMAEQDYGAMLYMFDQVSHRFGIKNTRINIPLHPTSDDAIVDLYAKAITHKTRLLMVCHMINITGHVLPIRKICDMAHEKGVEVMVDGAHTVGHLDFRIKDLNCDYFGSSLHKWLSVPLGAGLLYVKKEHIPKIWPRFAHWGKEDTDIMRLNHMGTHPVHTELAVSNAIEYYQRLGPKRKEERLKYLQKYWTEKVRELPNINVNTPKEVHRSCGIANVGLENMDPLELAGRLFDDYKIWTVGIDSAGVRGCRITPNIYTLADELDVLVDALITLSKT